MVDDADKSLELKARNGELRRFSRGATVVASLVATLPRQKLLLVLAAYT
jgi:hypothetical protein